MTLRVSGKNLDIGEALRTHAEARIDTALSKYAAGPVIGHVTIEPEGSGFRTDCTLHLSSGATLQADAKAHEPYASFNRAADKIERRVRRHRKRLSDHHGEPEEGLLNGFALSAGALAPMPKQEETERSTGDSAAEEALGLSPAVIAEPCSAFRKMTVSEAAMELDLTKASFLVFRHASDGRANLVYRREDGNIGWIDLRRS